MINILLPILLSLWSATGLEAEVPHSRWLARCSAVPTDAAEGITVTHATQRPGVRAWRLKKGTKRGILVCYRMGSYSGMPVYACHGPTILRSRMAASPDCTHAIPWSQVGSLPQAVKDWLADKTTNCGANQYGPGVVAGTDPCEEY
jgi:hypothetical protein